MQDNVYTRPKKPLFVPVADRRNRERAERGAPARAEVIAVDRATECHVTPADVAREMVGLLGPGRASILEPSAGTGALLNSLEAAGVARSDILAVERHSGLATRLASAGWPVVHSCFLEFAREYNGEKFGRVIMNPPFSQVRRHVKAAKALLRVGGVLVALVPATFTDPDAEELRKLPADTFQLATVHTKLIRVRLP